MISGLPVGSPQDGPAPAHAAGQDDGPRAAHRVERGRRHRQRRRPRSAPARVVPGSPGRGRRTARRAGARTTAAGAGATGGLDHDHRRDDGQRPVPPAPGRSGRGAGGGSAGAWARARGLLGLLVRRGGSGWRPVGVLLGVPRPDASGPAVDFDMNVLLRLAERRQCARSEARCGGRGRPPWLMRRRGHARSAGGGRAGSAGPS